jgi:hypothetical protein
MKKVKTRSILHHLTYLRSGSGRHKSKKTYSRKPRSRRDCE